MPIFFLSVLFIHKKLALNISFQFSGHMILNANLMLLLFKAEKIIQMNDVHSDETFFSGLFSFKVKYFMSLIPWLYSPLCYSGFPFSTFAFVPQCSTSGRLLTCCIGFLCFDQVMLKSEGTPLLFSGRAEQEEAMSSTERNAFWLISP